MPRAPADATERCKMVSGYYGRLPWQPQVSARASISHSVGESMEKRGGERNPQRKKGGETNRGGEVWKKEPACLGDGREGASDGVRLRCEGGKAIPPDRRTCWNVSGLISQSVCCCATCSHSLSPFLLLLSDSADSALRCGRHRVRLSDGVSMETSISQSASVFFCVFFLLGKALSRLSV